MNYNPSDPGDPPEREDLRHWKTEATGVRVREERRIRRSRVRRSKMDGPKTQTRGLMFFTP